MTDTERKEVEIEEYAKQLYLSKDDNRIDSDWPFQGIHQMYYRLQARRLTNLGYTKRPQDNNALVPLDSELLAEYLFKTKEIQSTMLQSKTGCQFFADLVCAKFGKDNSGMVPISDELIKHYESKETKEWMDDPMGRPDERDELLEAKNDMEHIMANEFPARALLQYGYSKFSQQLPKEPCSHDWQYNSDIKGVAQCSKCDEYQLPKERKVSLEEIHSVIKSVLQEYNIVWQIGKLQTSRAGKKLAQAILDLLNTVLDGKEGG